MATTPSVTGDRSSEQKYQHSVYDPNYLRRQCRWVRDDLDPQIARDGPDALHSDDILRLDEFLRRLLIANISLDDIRLSRLHLAIENITGQATRWPKRLIERADAVRVVWETAYGSLKNLTIPLYEPGGRLHGICKPEDLNKEKLIIKWLKSPGVKLSPLLARRNGDLGFRPGDWWINPLFAFRDSIIDSAEPTGGIVHDGDRAYAILLANDDEVKGPTADVFTYRAKNEDKGRYRLTAATRESRQPVRILRSHSLRSFWAPKAGVRYDGLYAMALRNEGGRSLTSSRFVVSGWSIKTRGKTKDTVYEISFKRLDNQASMDSVLRRPSADEVEDYKEYKRMRQLVRNVHNDSAKPLRMGPTPILTISGDGALDQPTVLSDNDSLFGDSV